jgi:hypothetical protein
MKDAGFSAQIKSAKLTARDEEDKTIRRVEFALTREFSIEVAEWLGPFACAQRDAMVRCDLDKCEIAIDAYHCKLSMTGAAGNVETDASGIKSKAEIKKTKEAQREEVTLSFEAYPTSVLMSFLAASLKEHVDCSFSALQLEIESR